MQINLEAAGATFWTALHAGAGLRIFQAFARSIQAPKEGAGGMYRFLFAFVQNLADNQDRKDERRPLTGQTQESVKATQTDSSGTVLASSTSTTATIPNESNKE